jgi:hypothetical protein
MRIEHPRFCSISTTVTVVINARYLPENCRQSGQELLDPIIIAVETVVLINVLVALGASLLLGHHLLDLYGGSAECARHLRKRTSNGCDQVLNGCVGGSKGNTGDRRLARSRQHRLDKASQPLDSSDEQLSDTSATSTFISWYALGASITPGRIPYGGGLVHLEHQHIEAWLSDPEGVWEAEISHLPTGGTTYRLCVFHASGSTRARRGARSYIEATSQP